MIVCVQAEMRNVRLPNTRLKLCRILQLPRSSNLHIYDFKCQVCMLSIYHILFSKMTGQCSHTVPDDYLILSTLPIPASESILPPGWWYEDICTWLSGQDANLTPHLATQQEM